MSAERHCRRATGILPSLILGACAVPATQVEVPTLPMQAALELSRQSAIPVQKPADPLPRLVAAPIPKGAPRPLLSTPDVRLAFLYEWVDTEGNKHFGEWVAIPVSGFDWIMSDGARESMSGNSGETTPAEDRN
jgi:hypothetical protein